MESSGPSVDIVSLRPVSKDRARVENTRRMAMLQDQMRRGGVSDSEHGRLVLAFIHHAMTNRLQALANQDAECIAYATMLEAIGCTERVARQATDEVFKRNGLTLPDEHA